MKQTVFRFGIYATIAIVVLSAIHFFVILPVASYEFAEIAGYLTMLLSMVFVFIGIRHYRDRVNQGSLSFGQGMKTGTLITLVPSVFFGMFDVLYTEVLNPTWKADYLAESIERARKTLPESEFATAKANLESQMEWFNNPVFQFLLMAATVFIIGLIVTIISSLALRRKA